MNVVAERVGVIRPDGTATPHSLTSAVQTLGNNFLELKKSVDQRTTSDPPNSLFNALDDNPITEITRTDIQRPVHTSRRLRTVTKQRNAGIAAFIGAVITAALASGVIPAFFRWLVHIFGG
jgi:hypothetical protein